MELCRSEITEYRYLVLFVVLNKDAKCIASSLSVLIVLLLYRYLVQNLYRYLMEPYLRYDMTYRR